MWNDHLSSLAIILHKNQIDKLDRETKRQQRGERGISLLLWFHGKRY